MATLVFSAVGTALGGPVGGAIGSLIGQSMDQQLLGGGLRKGPRMGDLAVQTSSYGTAIPRIYGTMRVAGSVIWATDLKEGTTLIGAKGQPQSEVFSYSVSMAVALSSRRALSIKRIWADGKLLRGAAGDFKVGTTFRFYNGSEDQPLDPLIASVEGIATTPAFRGLALAVFEDLELGEFGNRIPFLTFEVEADPGDVTVGDILHDVSAGAIEAPMLETVKGFAAIGASRRAAIDPLIESFDVQLFDDGGRFRVPGNSAPLQLNGQELGSAADGQRQPKVQRAVTSVASLPASLSLVYYDPARDYQFGQKRATIGHTGSEAKVEAPFVVEADQAKSLAQNMLARRWSGRERLKVQAGCARMNLTPGTRLIIAPDPKIWVAEKCVVEAMSVRLDLVATNLAAPLLPGDAGRAAESPDIIVSPTSIAIFELPLGNSDGSPAIQLASATASSGWKPVGLQVNTGQDEFVFPSAPRQTILGHALDALGTGQAYIYDDQCSVDVQLVDHSDWLTSCDDMSLLNGTNLAVLGDELFQFGLADPLGRGRFRLKHLLRGRRGTEWAMNAHAPGEPFALLEAGTFATTSIPASIVGGNVTVRPLGLVDGGAAPVSRLLTGQAARPLSPIALSARVGSNGTLQIAWVRRSRKGWDWIDEIDVPLGEASERYRVDVQGVAGALALEPSTTSLTLSAVETAPLGAGIASITVRQVGDHGVSSPTTRTIAIP